MTCVSAPGSASPHAAGMRLHPASCALSRVACAALALLLVACRWEVQYGSPPPPPPPEAFVGIDDQAGKVESVSASLQGDVECPGCFATDWQYGSCPAIECPDESGTEMRSSLCVKIPAVTSPYTQYGLAGGVEHYYYVTALVGDAESFDSAQMVATPQ